MTFLTFLKEINETTPWYYLNDWYNNQRLRSSESFGGLGLYIITVIILLMFPVIEFGSREEGNPLSFLDSFYFTYLCFGFLIGLLVLIVCLYRYAKAYSYEKEGILILALHSIIWAFLLPFWVLWLSLILFLTIFSIHMLLIEDMHQNSIKKQQDLKKKKNTAL